MLHVCIRFRKHLQLMEQGPAGFTLVKVREKTVWSSVNVRSGHEILMTFIVSVLGHEC